VTERDVEFEYASFTNGWPSVEETRLIRCRIREASFGRRRDVCRSELDGLRRLLAGGENFCTVALAYDDSTRERCGVTSDEDLDANVARALEAVPKGEVTPVLDTDDGPLVAQRVGGPVPSFADLRERMVRRAEDALVRKAHRAWLQALRKQYVVEAQLSAQCRGKESGG
jgi:hypothetical protein